MVGGGVGGIGMRDLGVRIWVCGKMGAVFSGFAPGVGVGRPFWFGGCLLFGKKGGCVL